MWRKLIKSSGFISDVIKAAAIIFARIYFNGIISQLGDTLKLIINLITFGIPLYYAYEWFKACLRYKRKQDDQKEFINGLMRKHFTLQQGQYQEPKLNYEKPQDNSIPKPFFKALFSFLFKNGKKVISICVAFIVIHFLYTKVIPNFNPTPAGALIIFLFIAYMIMAFFPNRNQEQPPKYTNSDHQNSPPPPPQHSETRINDTAGNLRARMVTDGHRTAIYDHAGNYHGYYDSRTNNTYDHAGNVVAQGNVLATLV